MKLGRNRVMVSAVLIVIVAVGVVAGVLSLNNSAPAAETVRTGGVINPQEYQSAFASTDHLLIDVRTPEEFASGHIAGAVNIPLADIQAGTAQIPTDQEVVLYCRSGNRSNQARSILNQRGYTSVYDLGGVIAWQAAGLPLE